MHTKADTQYGRGKVRELSATDRLRGIVPNVAPVVCFSEKHTRQRAVEDPSRHKNETYISRRARLFDHPRPQKSLKM